MMHPGDLLSLPLLKDLYEGTEETTFWGQKCTAETYVCEAVFGDGMHMLFVQPLNARPNGYLVRVDSSWPRDEVIDQHIDKVLTAIEDEVGASDDEDDEGNEIENDWPALSDWGCVWGHMKWPWFLEQISAKSRPIPIITEDDVKEAAEDIASGRIVIVDDKRPLETEQ